MTRIGPPWDVALSQLRSGAIPVRDRTVVLDFDFTSDPESAPIVLDIAVAATDLGASLVLCNDHPIAVPRPQ